MKEVLKDRKTRSPNAYGVWPLRELHHLSLSAESLEFLPSRTGLDVTC